MDYILPVDQYTRFLHYIYIDREDQLSSQELIKIQKCFQSCLDNTDATHIITGITLGIEFIVILQLPSNDELVQNIDQILDKIRDIFKGIRKYSSLTSDEENLLKKLLDTKIYSNIPYLMEMKCLLDLYQCRNIAKKKDCIIQPLVYTLQPLDKLFPHLKISYNFLPTKFNLKIEEHLIKLSILIKRLKCHINQSVLIQFQQELQKQYQNIQDMYNKEVEYFQNLIFTMRINQDDLLDVDQSLNHTNESNLKERIKQFKEHIDQLNNKICFINDLHTQNFQCYNVNRFNICENDTEELLEYKLRTNTEYDRILCSNDNLYLNNQGEFHRLYNQLIRERQHIPQLNLIYADFSYSSFKLNNIMILSSNRLINNPDMNGLNRSTSSFGSSISIRSLPSNDEFINILLLGEINAGKSTFINTFINYLRFETFNQAETNKPLVVIPASFSIMNTDSIEKQVFNLSDMNNSNNEDFNHPNQCRTQYCKSYIFNYPYCNGKKLRFIDTPGFGDKRGINQDNFNMESILKYINYFSSLNAICFLFKSNIKEINGSFRMFLKELNHFSGRDIHKNFIFCFTNTQSNSSDISKLIQTTLISSSMNDILLTKENTFYFDNQSFQYLVALQNGIEFNNQQRQQYELSWMKSVNESNRLINYIHNNLIPYRLHSRSQTIKQVQFEIIPMIRPILETIRNIFRYKILQKLNLTKEFIQLKPQIIHRKAFMCLLCKSQINQIGHFSIQNDTPHEINETCCHCSCSSNQHIPVNYILEYQLSNDILITNQYRMNDILSKLCYVSAEFSFFLIHVAKSTKEDLFNQLLVRIINDETNLCSNQFNLQLLNELKIFKNDYEIKLNNLKTNHQYSSLIDIYKYINTIQNYPMMHEQIVAIKQGRDIIMKENEYEISDQLINRSTMDTVSF